MHDQLEPRVRAVWQKLQQQYGWSLVQQPEVLIRKALEVLPQNKDPKLITEERIKFAIREVYWLRLYDAIKAMRENRRGRYVQEYANLASADLYIMAFRRALKKRVAEELAQDIAQKAVEAMISNIEKVENPNRFLIWARYQVNDFISRDQRLKKTESLEQEAERTNISASMESNTNVSDQVEDKILIETIIALLPTILSELQIKIIDLVILKGLKPHEAAELLNTTSPHIRVEKSRSIKKIRTHPLIQQWLHKD